MMYDDHMINHDGKEQHVAFDDSELAPPDKGWHFRYVVAHRRISRILDELQNDPSMQHAEDLGDWIETLSTLISFRPGTRDDIEIEAREWDDKQWLDQGRKEIDD